MPVPLPAPRLALVVLTFAAAFACYIDRVGFPIVYTAIARDAWIPKTIQGSVHSAILQWIHRHASPRRRAGDANRRTKGHRVGVRAVGTDERAHAERWKPNEGDLVVPASASAARWGRCSRRCTRCWRKRSRRRKRNRAVSFMTSGMYFGSAFAMVAVPVAMRLGGAAFATTATGCCAFAWLLAWNAVNEKMSILRPFEDTTVLPRGDGG